jgi:hypothetical protein
MEKTLLRLSDLHIEISVFHSVADDSTWHASPASLPCGRAVSKIFQSVEV